MVVFDDHGENRRLYGRAFSHRDFDKAAKKDDAATHLPLAHCETKV